MQKNRGRNMKITSYPVCYIAKFVDWKIEKTKGHSQHQDYKYTLIFRSFDEDLLDAPDACIHAFFECYGHDPDKKLQNTMSPQMIQFLELWEKPLSPKIKVLDSLIRMANSDFLVTADSAPRMGNFWIGVTRVEKLPINLQDYYASKTSGN